MNFIFYDIKMVENLDNYTYNSNTDGFEGSLATEIKNVLKDETDLLDKQGEEVIKSLDKKKLAKYIESSFKTSDGRLTYSEMKSYAGKFHGFMTQAAIDMLGSLDQYKNKKYDKNGNIDNTGKTIDEWLKQRGGIDNKYGGGTRQMVKMIQHILGVNEDGAAGPQFFAKICAVLKGESINSNDFKVKNHDNYKYNFNSTQQTVVDNPHGKCTPETTIFQYTMPFGYKLGKPKNKKVSILTTSGEDTGCYLEDTGLINPILKYNNGYDKNISGEFKLDNSTNTIIYLGPNQVEKKETNLINIEDENTTKFTITTQQNNYGSRYNLECSENKSDIQASLYKIQFDDLAATFSNDGGYYWFNRNPYTGYNYSSNPFAWVYCGAHNSASVGNAAKDPDFIVKINFHDFMNKDGSLDKAKIINELNKIKMQRETVNSIAKSKNDLYSSINEFTLGELGLDEKKNQPGYQALMAYFENGKVKIDKKHTRPKWDDSGNLIFDLDPKGSGNCPKYFTGITINKAELVNNQGLYDLSQFKVAFAKKIDEIINNNILTTT